MYLEGVVVRVSVNGSFECTPPSIGLLFEGYIGVVECFLVEGRRRVRLRVSTAITLLYGVLRRLYVACQYFKCVYFGRFARLVMCGVSPNGSSYFWTLSGAFVWFSGVGTGREVGGTSYYRDQVCALGLLMYHCAVILRFFGRF